ncbi:substrate-binding domain-containing protein [uncultured Helcococcus sp.]|uniref:substrate-binding domain-containing protein n=1 Tax=uncultured Helcococcus sp. TaxID=1072508 RepID=UPI00261CC6C1|nr:substrate-binding domain-containing protein [uncultured Helcococcus sp.]
MKKIISILLALVLTLSLVACSNNSKETKAENPTETKTEVNPGTDGGSAAGSINVYTRDASSGTRGAFEELIDFEGKLTDKAAETSGNGDMATKVGQDTNAIGYVSLTTDFQANKIKALQYEGVEATEENVLNGSYALKRPFSYVTRSVEDYADENVKKLVDAFIVFMTQSTEGLEAVASAGGIVDVTAGKPWEELKADHPVVDQDNSALSIRTGGSTSVEKALKAAIEAFQPLAGNVQFVTAHTGSSDGYKRVLGDEKDGANAADIGFASREFKTEEDVAKGMHSGVFAQDAVVVAVAESNPLTNLTKQQIFDIFTGALNTWEEVK